VKVVVDLIWGGLIISACTLVVAAMIYHEGQFISIAILLGGLAASISMTEQYHYRKRRDFYDKFKR
jgi:hypothetical protein